MRVTIVARLTEPLPTGGAKVEEFVTDRHQAFVRQYSNMRTEANHRLLCRAQAVDN